MVFITGIIPIIYMALIWYLSSQPSGGVIVLGTYDALIKESLHLIEFGILYLLWILHFITSGRLSKRTSLIAVIIAVCYALLDEAHQYFVPSRSATITDLIKDFIGIYVAWYFVNKRYFSNKRKQAHE